MPANAKSWTHLPFGAGVPVPYRAELDAEQFSRLKAGLIPRVMEDKWFIYYEEPNLFLHRGWTGHPVFRLTVKAVLDGAKVIEAVLSQEVAQNSKWDVEYSARLLDFLICNLLLGQQKPFPAPADVPESVGKLFQHHISGTGYPNE